MLPVGLDYLFHSWVPPHNPRDPAVKQIVQTNWQHLGRSTATKDLIDWQLKFGYRRAPNLRDLVVRARVYTDHPSEYPKCKRPRSCKYCPLLDLSGSIRNRQYTRFRTEHKGSCQSNNSIYCITCTRTKKVYVGQTKRKIMSRMYEHLSDIKNNRDTTVARHFNQ